MLCPLIQVKCVEGKCAWYDNGNKCCAVLGLLIERVKATEAVQDSAIGGVDVRMNVSPVVQVRDVIKTIIPEVRHEQPINTVPNQPSEPLPTVSWFKPSEEGNKAGAGATVNAGVEPEDVGDQSQGTDSHWGENISGQDITESTDVHGLG